MAFIDTTQEFYSQRGKKSNKYIKNTNVYQKKNIQVGVTMLHLSSVLHINNKYKRKKCILLKGKKYK